MSLGCIVIHTCIHPVMTNSGQLVSCIFTLHVSMSSTLDLCPTLLGCGETESADLCCALSMLIHDVEMSLQTSVL
jgi:hypothetical protein